MNPLNTLEKMLNKYKIISMMLVCAGVQANAETWQFVQDNLIFQPIDAVGNVHNVRLLTCEDRNKLTDNLIIPPVVTHEGIDYTVVSIADSAFRLHRFRKIDIPESVKRIGKMAFAINPWYFIGQPHFPDSIIIRSSTPPQVWTVSELTEYSDTPDGPVNAKSYVTSDAFNYTMPLMWGINDNAISMLYSMLNHDSPYLIDPSAPYIEYSGKNVEEIFDAAIPKFRFRQINTRLFVPAEALEKYKNLCSYEINEQTLTSGYATDMWGRFKFYNTIEELENGGAGENANQTNGINSAVEDASPANSDLYDLTGRLIISNFNGDTPDWLAPGIYIYRGRKVAIK